MMLGIFLLYGPAKITLLSDEKYEQNTRLVVTILIANADNSTIHNVVHTTTL